MTRTTNARVAGVAFLVYIAAGLTLMARVSGAYLTVMLSFVAGFCAIVLGVTLYAITRDEDPNLAMFAMLCRVAEGILGAMFVSAHAALSSLEAADSSGSNAEMMRAIDTFVRRAAAMNVGVSATFFAVGSTVFAYLFLRGRTIPVVLAWLGVLASALLVICLPAQIAGALPHFMAVFMWMPALVFELWLAVWLIVKGVATPASRQSRSAM